MPIPIIIGAVAAAAGIYGIAKGVGGAKDHSNAKTLMKVLKIWLTILVRKSSQAAS